LKSHHLHVGTELGEGLRADICVLSGPNWYVGFAECRTNGKSEAMSPQRILITNDDGIAAPGIRYLARVVVDHGFDVVVAAPSEESSGISAAMTAVVGEGRVVIDRRKLAMLDSVSTFVVSASPGYIVTLGRLGAFDDPPELVMSGISRGERRGARFSTPARSAPV
jgi:hypothetical protein